jgi:AcrR family transcriptional regulator
VTDARDRLLAATVEHVAAHGLGELSLRGVAEAIGTSHRMLIYHFGSKEGLLSAVVRSVEADQRAALAALLPAAGEDPSAAAWRFWQRLTEPELAPLERLFFEMVGQALRGRPGTEELLANLVDPWIAPLAELAVAAGADPATARADARLATAVTRGLLLDLLATGDRLGVDAAMARFTDLYLAQASVFAR